MKANNVKNLNHPHILAEIDSKVVEADERVRVWSLGHPMRGVQVTGTSRRLVEITASCYLVLPELTADDGPVSVLTLSRGRPGNAGETPAPQASAGETPAPQTASRSASFWDPVELREERGGVFFHATYDPSRDLVEVGMNVGGETPELLGVTLTGASPALVCGRVLELYVEINADRLFASLGDGFADGEVALDGMAPSTGGSEYPWNAPFSGSLARHERRGRAARAFVAVAAGLRPFGPADHPGLGHLGHVGRAALRRRPRPPGGLSPLEPRGSAGGPADPCPARQGAARDRQGPRADAAPPKPLEPAS